MLVEQDQFIPITGEADAADQVWFALNDEIWDNPISAVQFKIGFATVLPFKSSPRIGDDNDLLGHQHIARREDTGVFPPAGGLLICEQVIIQRNSILCGVE